jgi:hypothetical protein
MRVIQYKTQPDKADENESLIRSVFAELKESKPEGVRYAALRLADGSFAHIVAMADSAPLTTLKSFQRFQSGIKDRVVTPPVVNEATIVGNYRLFDE